MIMIQCASCSLKNSKFCRQEVSKLISGLSVVATLADNNKGKMYKQSHTASTTNFLMIVTNFVGIATFNNQILQVFRFCLPVFAHQRAFWRHKFFVRRVFVTKIRNPQPSPVFLRHELVLLFSNRKCSLRTDQLHLMSNSYELGLLAFTFDCATELVKELIRKRKTSSVCFHRWKDIRERYQTVFDWKVKAL